jgi:serine phosphatase RsbU (regulator of sigma subunit)
MKPSSLAKMVFTGMMLFTALCQALHAQEGFDNSTRALYILDISKYVEWDDSIQSHADFKIAVLGNDVDLYWELNNMAKTRKFIQDKPIKIFLFRELEDFEKVQVLYVNKNEGFKIDQVLRKTAGNNTLVISEGYEFQQSMLNFIVVDGKPRFEVNEARLNHEKLKVSELFLAQAVKTRADWEELYKVTDVALQQEKEVVKQQSAIIDSQKVVMIEQEQQILNQQRRLEELNSEIERKQKTLEQKTAILDHQEKQISLQTRLISRQQAEAATQKEILGQQATNIQEQESKIMEQTAKISAQETVLIEQLKAIEKQKLLLYFAIIALVLVSGLGYFIFRAYRIKIRANRILAEKNVKISQQKDEIEKQRDEIGQQKEIAEKQRDQIAYQKKHITDSIEYAKKIQTALLPSLELFSADLDHFVLYKPRDIVSGDFYWVTRIDGQQIMSMLGVSLINEIVISKRITQPAEIMNILRNEVINSLKQREETSEIKDGMDMCVCNYDFNSRTLEFAGANNPLYLFQAGELHEVKGDKMPVAIHSNMAPFTNHRFELKKGDTFYIFSDGYVDQFGGANLKKYLSKNFRNTLLEMQSMPMLQQGTRLNEIFEDWRKDVEQIDDVTVIGVRI